MLDRSQDELRTFLPAGKTGFELTICVARSELRTLRCDVDAAGTGALLKLDFCMLEVHKNVRFRSWLDFGGGGSYNCAMKHTGEPVIDVSSRGPYVSGVTSARHRNVFLI